MQAAEAYDTFCFTISWQGLRNSSTNLVSTTAQAAPEGHSDGASADELQDDAPAPEDLIDWTVQLACVQHALAHTPRVCSAVNLASKPEAVTAAVEHCATIAYTSHAYDAKSAKSGPTTAAMGMPPG